MTMKTTPAHCYPHCYLYAVGSSADARGAAGPGIDASCAWPLSCGPVAAWVSDLGQLRIRPQRRHLAAHHQVIRQLMERATVLPVTFGTVAGSRDEVMAMLGQHGDGLALQLERVRGKVEMGLRVTWDVPNVFEHLLDGYPPLAALRDRLRARAGGPSQGDCVELGRAFGRLLEHERERHTASVRQALAEVCDEIFQQPPAQEQEVMHLACLVERGRLGEFEEAAAALARGFDDRCTFGLSGPWAPHHFSDVVIA